MKKLKLFPKTFVYTLSLMLVIILLTHLLIYFMLPGVYHNQQESELKKETGVLIEEITKAPDEERLTLVTDFASKWNANIMVEYDGYTCEMNLLGELSPSALNSQAGVTDTAVITEDTKGGIKISLGDNARDRADFFWIEESFAGGKGYIKAVVSRQQIENAVNAIVLILPFTAIICILVSTVFSLLYARSLTKPIAKISQAAGQMKDLRPDILCESATGDEIGLLADNINSLYQTLLLTIKELEQEIHKVEKAEIQKTDFLRAASHELKTPVTAVNAMLENMILNVGKYKDRDTYLGKCKVMTERLASMIKEILDTSKLDMHSPQEMAEIDLVQTVISVSEPYRIIGKSNGISFNVDMPDSYTIYFAVGGLERVLSNLLSNAVSYTKKGGGIWIYLHGRQLVIENECKVIPAR